MNLKEMRERRKALVEQMAALAAKADADKRDFTADEQTAWDAADAEVRSLEPKIQRAERLEDLNEPRRERDLPGREDRDSREDRDDDTEDDDEPETRSRFDRWERAPEATRALVLRGWLREQNGLDASERQREAAQQLGVNLRRGHIDIPLMSTTQLREARAQAAGSGTAGGYVVQGAVMPALERGLLQFGGLRSFADVMRTETGADLPWPTVDDTSNTGEQVGENAANSEQDVAFGQMIMRAYKFSSKAVKVSAELLEDSAVDLPSLIGAILGERLGRITASRYAQGSGASTIRGLLTAAPTGKTAAGQTAFTADELFDMQHSVDPAYRMGARWLMHDTILTFIRKLKDGEGNYLLQRGIAAGSPDLLLGSPVVIDNSMPSSLTAGSSVLAYGDLSYYKIRDVRAIRLHRLVERFRVDSDADGFIAFLRSDGDLLNPGTGPVKKLVLAP